MDAKCNENKTEKMCEFFVFANSDQAKKKKTDRNYKIIAPLRYSFENNTRSYR